MQKPKPIERPDFERHNELVSRIMEAHGAESLFKSGKKKMERYNDISDFLAKTTFVAAFAGFADALEENRKGERREDDGVPSMKKKLRSKKYLMWHVKGIHENPFEDLRIQKDRRTIDLFSKDSEKLNENALEFLRNHPQEGISSRIKDFISRGRFRDRIGRRAYHDIFRTASYASEVGFNEFSYSADAEKAIRSALLSAVVSGKNLRKKYPSITGIKARKAGA